MRSHSFLPNHARLRFFLTVLIVSLFFTGIVMLFFLPMDEITSYVIKSDSEVKTIKSINWKVSPQ